jgi:glycosyltransferase involved in cell wall biosynthesis
MPTLELTILMPCLDEAETLATCIRKAKGFLSESNVNGEVLIADNGSTDRSPEIAIEEGARLVRVAERGYGAALLGGISAAYGRYAIMGDADDSYDFAHLMPFVERLREGADVVVGNRFQGRIERGAMPLLHKYLGNPSLSLIGRLFFKIEIGDFCCGLRGFNCDRVRALSLRSTGMEFAIEMVVRSALAGYRMDEIPTILKKDGRSRPPYLRTWRDGWRHLSFLLMHNPKWLFLYPGVSILALGFFAALVLLPGEVIIGGVGFDIHTFAVACTAVLIGVQSISFAVIARRFATAHGLIPRSRRFARIIDAITFEKVLVVAMVIGLAGLAGLIWCFLSWASMGFGALEYSSLMRVLIVSLTALAIGVQLALTGFLSGIMEIPTK